MGLDNAGELVDCLLVAPLINEELSAFRRAIGSGVGRHRRADDQRENQCDD
jgi:hypothetical protein